MRVQTIEIIRAEDFRVDDSLRATLVELAAPSYVDPRAVIERELRHCDTLYLGRDADGRLVCFFMAAHEMLEIADRGAIPTLYLGLSATRQDAKNSGKVTTLYARALDDARRWQAGLGQPIVLWGTTATPTAYLAAHTLLADTEPRRDGTYHPDRVWLAHMLRRKFYGCEGEPADHPYVLKGVAHNTRYAPAEVDRIARICRMKEFSLFVELDIDEARGDRLLFTGHIPMATLAMPAAQGITNMV